MPQEERKEVIEALKSVDRVVFTRHPEHPKDMSVAEALRRIKPDIFANGGDRKTHNTPEDAACRELGITMAFNAGRGGKVQSSSWLLHSYLRKSKKR